MALFARPWFACCLAAASLCVGDGASAQPHPGQVAARATTPAPPPTPTPTLAPTPEPAPSAARSRSASLVTTLTFADLGYRDGFRFANLGGRRDIYVQLPQGLAINLAELVLSLDDMSAHDARRSLEVLVNDRSAAAIALDGHAAARTVRVPLGNTKTPDGFLKITFQYAGAATQDRCIDVRSVGDSLTIRPESAVDIEVDQARVTDVATTAALMPRDVAVVLPGRRLMPRDIAAALTVARSLAASGRRVTFRYGYETLAEFAKRPDPKRWTTGLVVIGTPGEAANILESPGAVVAGPMPAFGTLAAVRVAGLPALLVSDVTSAQASRLLGSPWLPATRGVAAASIGDSPAPMPPTDRISFNQLGLAPALAEVFGRADISVAIDARMLPPGTVATRLALDVMVAPDGAGERAVVSVFVNERLLSSMVAQIDEPTRFDLPLPDGLVGSLANVRVVIQRRSAQGDCRFDPQGFPAQILGTSTVVLAPADGRVHDFSDLVARFAKGVEVLLPASGADSPAHVLPAVADVLAALSPETAAITVKITEPGTSAPAAPFISVRALPPADATPRARFDRGRVVVVDRADRTVLDLGGFSTGAVAQIVMSGDLPGVWIKPLAPDGTLPDPPELRLQRGDVAFLDNTGVTMAMSTERDTVVRIAYPDSVSWLTVAERFRSWIIGGLWLLATLVVLLALQTIFRRRADAANE